MFSVLNNKFIKFSVVVGLMLISSQGLSSDLQRPTRISIEPIIVLLGGLPITVEYKLNDSIALSIKYVNWSRDEDELRSITPYARYFFNKEENGFTLGLGYTTMDIEAENLNSSGTTSFDRSGLYFEGSYLWQGERFFNEVGYSQWLVDDVDEPGVVAVDLQGVPGPFYRFGFRF